MKTAGKMFFFKLLVLFILTPIIELSLLLEIGKRIGTLPTLGIIVLTGILGAYLVRGQGFMILKRIQNELEKGTLPGDSLMEGAIILAGGILLLTPGLITDALGFISLIPPGRMVIKRFLLNWLRSRIKERTFTF